MIQEMVLAVVPHREQGHHIGSDLVVSQSVALFLQLPGFEEIARLGLQLRIRSDTRARLSYQTVDDFAYLLTAMVTSRSTPSSI
jgi:hypothetical protein